MNNSRNAGPARKFYVGEKSDGIESAKSFGKRVLMQF